MERIYRLAWLQRGACLLCLEMRGAVHGQMSSTFQRRPRVRGSFDASKLGSFLEAKSLVQECNIKRSSRTEPHSQRTHENPVLRSRVIDDKDDSRMTTRIGFHHVRVQHGAPLKENPSPPSIPSCHNLPSNPTCVHGLPCCQIPRCLVLRCTAVDLHDRREVEARQKHDVNST